MAIFLLWLVNVLKFDWVASNQLIVTLPTFDRAMSDQDFGFPFKPYAIQEEFMKELYNVLDQGKIGIFESPTGTVRQF